MIHIEIPQDVAFILGKIRNAGYEAYAVGGCVRDSLLKKIPKDWDITTSALPEQIKEIFPRTIDTGIKHGTVTVMINSTGYEVTTYRVDGEYLDGRHPEEVEFTANLDEDLKRRDFTINAFVYNEAEGVKDLFGGLKDLEDGIIRCVGVAEERFGEDALRILRAVRFAAVLSFTIEPETYKAAVKLGGNLSKVSAERIKAELEKTLVSDNPDYICLLKDMGLSKVILPELDEVKDTLGLKKALKAVNKEAKTRWAVLCYYLESELNTGRNAETGSISKKVMHGLKFDNKTMDCVIRFLTVSGNNISDKDIRIYSRRLLNRIGEEDIYHYLDFADAVGCIPEDFFGGYESIKNAIDDILEKRECFSLKQLAVNGRDIMKECDINGKQVGELLDFLLETVMVSPEKNSREVLIEEAKAYGKQQL